MGNILPTRVLPSFGPREPVDLEKNLRSVATELPPAHKDINGPRLSSRAYKLVLDNGDFVQPAGQIWTKMLANQYSAQTNPSGLVNFGVAENSLMQEELNEFFANNFRMNPLDYTYGDSITGSRRLFAAQRKLFNDYFNPVEQVLDEHIITGAGVSAIVDQAIQMICDVGDAVLIAKPYYNGFDADASLRSSAQMVGVDLGELELSNPASPSTLAAFESQLLELNSKGIKTRAVILCNPHNPLGFNYPRETLIAYAKFCQKWDLHLFSDEIYALSQFENDNLNSTSTGEYVKEGSTTTLHTGRDTVGEKRIRKKEGFVSMLSIDVRKEASCDPARVHVLYGASKDWGLNGFRIGTLVTQHNKGLYNALLCTSILMKVSSAGDILWSAVMSDTTFRDNFISTNKSRMTDTLRYCQAFFKSHGIPVFQPEAAHFIWIDLNKYLDRSFPTTNEQEQNLWQAFFDNGVYLNPGYKSHSDTPGWFRFTFVVKRETLNVGLERFERVLQTRLIRLSKK